MNRFELQKALKSFVEEYKKYETSQDVNKLISDFSEKYCSSNILVNNKVQQFRNIASSLSELYEMKNADYGDSFGKTFRQLGIISAITRMSDKFNRIMSLTTKLDRKVKDEAIDDTLRDLASYCIMTLIELQNGKDKKL